MPASAWAPSTAPADRRDEADPFARPAPASGSARPVSAGSEGGSAAAGGPIEPHPYRDADAPSVDEDVEPHPYRSAAVATPVQPALPPFPAGGFNGFGAANPGTSSARREPGSVSDSRPPGISAFGDQRVRVPGATLGDLPDAPPTAAPGGPSSHSPVPSSFSGPDAGSAAAPVPLRQTSNGLPVRGSGAPTVRPGEPGYPTLPQGAGGFTPARGGEPQGASGFAPRSAENVGQSSARRQDGTNPYAASAAQAVAGQRSGMFGGASADASAVPQPRTPMEPSLPPAAQHGTAAAPPSATGTARPVSASASVPMASRVLPPLDADEPAAPAAAPRARVYGRAPQPDPSAPAEPPVGAVPPPAFGGHREPEAHESANREAGVRQSGSRESAARESGVREPVRDAGAHGSGFTAPEQRAGTPLSPAGPPAPPAAPPAAGRATASARVAPPNGYPFAPGSPANPPGGGAQGRPDAVPFSEPTSDLAGRGRGTAAQQAPYSEHTSDLAGRGPYVPAPALPTLHPSVPTDARTNGFAGQHGASPGSATSRATVTPPGPADTSSWPGPAENGEQGRFDAFKPEITPAPDVDKAEPPHVSKLPVLVGIILVSALLLGGALGIVWLLARPSGNGFAVDVGQCVKPDGDKAVTATCGDAGAFEVVSKVDTKEQCADPRLPYVLNPAGNGRSQVLCLKPRG